MEVDRYTRHDGRVLYRVHSGYDLDSIAIEPKEAMLLLTWLQEHENEIVQDALTNSTVEAMKGL